MSMWDKENLPELGIIWSPSLMPGVREINQQDYLHKKENASSLKVTSAQFEAYNNFEIVKYI